MKLLFSQFRILGLARYTRAFNPMVRTLSRLGYEEEIVRVEEEHRGSKVQEIQLNDDVVLRKNRNEADNRKPLVLLFGWGNGKLSYLKKYSEVYELQGYTTILSRSSLLDSLVFPSSRAKPAVSKMLHALQPHLPQSRDNPVIVQCFSNGGMVLHDLFSQFLKDPNSPYYQLFEIKGVIYDSCPIVPQLKNLMAAVMSFNAGISNPIARAMTTLGVALVMPFVFAFNPFTVKLRKNLFSDALAHPQLYLYSKSDQIADFRVIDFIVNRRNSASGIARKKCWDKSSHCQHLRIHPEEYKAEICQFLGEFSV